MRDEPLLRPGRAQDVPVLEHLFCPRLVDVETAVGEDYDFGVVLFLGALVGEISAEASGGRDSPRREDGQRCLEVEVEHDQVQSSNKCYDCCQCLFASYRHAIMHCRFTLRIQLSRTNITVDILLTSQFKIHYMIRFKVLSSVISKLIKIFKKFI